VTPCSRCHVSTATVRCGSCDSRYCGLCANRYGGNCAECRRPWQLPRAARIAPLNETEILLQHLQVDHRASVLDTDEHEHLRRTHYDIHLKAVTA
jgi:hypothetical protein